MSEGSSAAGDDAHAKAELEAYVRNTLVFRGFVDYRRSFEVAGVASEMLDELENHLNSGSAETVRPALLRALTRLRKITEQSDDSSGSIGIECQRAADLYARACRLGEPDSVKLATWLVKFRADSPGWPNLILADFVDAFDARALETYRRAVAALDRKLDDRDQWGRFEVDAMLLELADRATRGLHAHHIRHWEDGGLTELANLVLLCPYHHRLHHRGGITITGLAHELSVIDSAGRELDTGSLARPPTQPPPAVAPCPGPTGESADWWWYDPFQPQPPPSNN